MKQARKDYRSEANLENTPESITAIFDKYKPQAPNTREYHLAKKQALDESVKVMDLMSAYVESLKKVKAELDVLKVPKANVVVRNQYKKIVDEKIAIWSAILKTAIGFVEYIREH